MVAYLTGVLPVHRVDGRPRVHVHQVVVVVASHHTAPSLVELHGQAGVAGDGTHGVGVVAAPPGDLQAVPPEGGSLSTLSSLLSWRLASSLPLPLSSLGCPGEMQQHCLDLAARPNVHWETVMCRLLAGWCCRPLARRPRPAAPDPVGTRRSRESPQHVRWSGQSGRLSHPPSPRLVGPGALMSCSWPPCPPHHTRPPEAASPPSVLLLLLDSFQKVLSVH